MNEDELKKKIEIREEIRISLENYLPNEISQIAIQEIEANQFVDLKDKFPKATEENIDYAIPIIISGGKYKLDVTPFNKKWIIYKNPDYKQKTWEERHPFWDKVRTGFITGVISLLVGWLIFQATSRRQNRAENQQEQRLDDLSSELTNLQKHIKDSAIHITTKRIK